MIMSIATGKWSWAERAALVEEMVYRLAFDETFEPRVERKPVVCILVCSLADDVSREEAS
jgi:hypothetical protein